MPDTPSDDEILAFLDQELTARIPVSRADIPAFLAALKTLPPGLRSMAAVYELDVSMALDDLVWHFRNWYDRELAEETSRGLHILGATVPARLFDAAYGLVSAKWDDFGRAAEGSHEQFNDWCDRVGLTNAADSLNAEFWADNDSHRPHGLFHYWVQYARAHMDEMAYGPTKPRRPPKARPSK